MCSRTPIWCPACGNTLFGPVHFLTQCPNGHSFNVSELPLVAGQRITSQYYAAGHSQVMALTGCRHCIPL